MAADLVMATFAHDLAATEDQLVAALRDAEAYRLLGQVALERCHRLGKEVDRLRGENRRLADESRRLRERTMREVA